MSSKEQKDFHVYTLTDVDLNNKQMYSHWSKGLTMYIKKDGVSISLNSDEIIELMKSLPRTVGGRY